MKGTILTRYLLTEGITIERMVTRWYVVSLCVWISLYIYTVCLCVHTDVSICFLLALIFTDIYVFSQQSLPSSAIGNSWKICVMKYFLLATCFTVYFYEGHCQWGKCCILWGWLYGRPSPERLLYSRLESPWIWIQYWETPPWAGSVWAHYILAICLAL